MTLEAAKESLRKVYERYVMSVLKLDRVHGTFNGADTANRIPVPTTVNECVKQIEHLAEKTLLIDEEIADAAHYEERVKHSLEMLGLD